MRGPHNSQFSACQVQASLSDQMPKGGQRTMVHVNLKRPIIGHYYPCFIDEKTETGEIR